MDKKKDNSSIAKILGANIKRVRILEHISQEQLAEKIGKTAHFISLIERGKSGLSVATLIDICIALNTDTNSIFDNLVNSSICTNNFLNKSFDAFEDKDKEMVSYLINYIINSKK